MLKLTYSFSVHTSTAPGPNTPSDEAVLKIQSSNNKKRFNESNEKLVNSNELNATIAVVIGISSTLAVILVIILLMMMIRSRDEARNAANSVARPSTANDSNHTIQLNDNSSADFNHMNNQIAQNENQQLIDQVNNQWQINPSNHCSMMMANDGNNLWTLDNMNGQRWIPDVCPTGHHGNQMVNLVQMDIGHSLNHGGNVWIQDMNGYPMTSCDPLLGTPSQLSSDCTSMSIKGDNSLHIVDTCNCHVTVLPVTAPSPSTNSGQSNLQMYKVTTI